MGRSYALGDRRLSAAILTPGLWESAPSRPGVSGPLAFFITERRFDDSGIQVLAAASLALNQRGEGSSPSGPTDCSGCRRAWFHPPVSEAGPRWFKSSHPDLRKGKPIGDGTPLETGRGLKPLRVRLPLLPLTKCPWPSGPGVGLPNRTGGFDSRRAL